jgi:hypothetical protein
VIVLRGTYRPMPLPGYDKEEIQLYGKDLVPNSGAGGGGGTFAEFLQGAGSFLGRRLVAEIAYRLRAQKENSRSFFLSCGLLGRKSICTAPGLSASRLLMASGRV